MRKFSSGASSYQHINCYYYLALRCCQRYEFVLKSHCMGETPQPKRSYKKLHCHNQSTYRVYREIRAWLSIWDSLWVIKERVLCPIMPRN